MRAAPQILAVGGLLSLLILSGCGGGDTSGSGGSGGSTSTSTTTTTAAPGSVSMAFSVSNGVKQSPNLKDPLKGSIYGSLYKQEDVTITGPIDGAMEVASVQVADVDLTTMDVSATKWNGADIPEGSYTFLAFFDLDGNGAMTSEPDAGDPVTLPSANKFDVVSGQETALTATFDILFN